MKWCAFRSYNGRWEDAYKLIFLWLIDIIRDARRKYNVRILIRANSCTGMRFFRNISTKLSNWWGILDYNDVRWLVENTTETEAEVWLLLLINMKCLTPKLNLIAIERHLLKRIRVTYGPCCPLRSRQVFLNNHTKSNLECEK